MSDVWYYCRECGRRVAADGTDWRCTCGGPLDLPARSGFSRDLIDAAEPSLWRYRAGLWGLGVPQRTWFGEGLTPLVKRPWAGLSLRFKVEGMMPTGSFKDRGAAVLIHHLANLGVQEILEDSSGNGGAAIAAYAAAAGIRCHIYVPEQTSTGKITQLKASGANVRRIPGNREATSEAAIRDAERWVYASHNWQPMFIEGVKTVAYEIWEQLDFKVPEAIVLPVSYGSNLLGLYRGFNELLRANEIDQIPRLYAAQAANVAPLHHFSQHGTLDLDPKPTVAEGIAGTHPIRIKEMLEAVTVSGGRTIPVEEKTIIPNLIAFASTTGLYVEPTSAVAIAAAEVLANSGEIGEDTVVLLTGGGLKATERITSELSRVEGAKA